MNGESTSMYWKHAEVERSWQEIADEVRKKVREAEMEIIKAEQSVEKAQKRLQKALLKKRDAHATPVKQYEWRYVECEENEAEWKVDKNGIPLQFRDPRTQKWTSCVGESYAETALFPPCEPSATSEEPSTQDTAL